MSFEPRFGSYKFIPISIDSFIEKQKIDNPKIFLIRNSPKKIYFACSEIDGSYVSVLLLCQLKKLNVRTCLKNYKIFSLLGYAISIRFNTPSI